MGCSIYFCLGELRGGSAKEKGKFKLIWGRGRKKTARQKKETTVPLESEEKARMLEASMHGRTRQVVSVGRDGGAELETQLRQEKEFGVSSYESPLFSKETKPVNTKGNQP